MRLIPALFATLLATPALAVDCTDWNRMEFWYGASAQTVTDCVASGVDINARDSSGRTALHNTITLSDSAPSVAETLIRLGANVNARDNKGRTPLHANAAGYTWPQVNEQLINAGADPKPRDNYGLTPWFYDQLPTCGGYFLPCMFFD